MPIIIDTLSVGKRLDIFLHEKFPEHSRSLLAKSIIAGNILINQKTQKPSYSLKQNDAVLILSEFSSPCVLRLAPYTSIEIPLLFENEHFLVIDKPAGIQVHPSSAEKEKTVANWLVARYPAIATVGEDPTRPGIVHRLDKDTSGVLVIAKTQVSFNALKKLFAERNMQKEYLAVVHGTPSPTSGIINKPIARSASFRKQVIPEGRTKWKGTPREAVTEYKTLGIKNRKYKVSPTHSFATSDFSLLALKPKTGRMHQIRVHLASIGHPVVGDTLYFRKEFKKLPSASRQLLHAYKISFLLFGKKYTFHADLPDDFTPFLKNSSAS